MHENLTCSVLAFSRRKRLPEERARLHVRPDQGDRGGERHRGARAATGSGPAQTLHGCWHSLVFKFASPACLTKKKLQGDTQRNSCARPRRGSGIFNKRFLDFLAIIATFFLFKRWYQRNPDTGKDELREAAYNKLILGDASLLVDQRQYVALDSEGRVLKAHRNSLILIHPAIDSRTESSGGLTLALPLMATEKGIGYRHFWY